MSVNDEDEHPWLVPEKAFIRELIKAGKPVLGICLGAQLIATLWARKFTRTRNRKLAGFRFKELMVATPKPFNSQGLQKFSTGTVKPSIYLTGLSDWLPARPV